MKYAEIWRLEQINCWSIKLNLSRNNIFL
jgi:hypothetical protein